jgi:hypothetical protein
MAADSDDPVVQSPISNRWLMGRQRDV